MNTIRGKRRKILVVLAIIIALYVFIPMIHRQTPPFRLFHLDANKITGIEVVHWGQCVQFEQPEEITELVEKLNHVYFFFWIPISPRGGSDYILHIHYEGAEEVYTVAPSGFVDGIGYFADMKFLTTELFSPT